jgi:hypothetical protein
MLLFVVSICQLQFLLKPFGGNGKRNHRYPVVPHFARCCPVVPTLALFAAVSALTRLRSNNGTRRASTRITGGLTPRFY